MKYELKERIRYSEVNENGHLSLNALIDLFQDVSVFHSADVGYGVYQLKEKNQAWLISGWQIDILGALPRLGDEITARTWAYDFEAFYGLRNYQLTDTQGKRIVAGNAYWVLFDTKTQRPVRVDEEMAQRFHPEERQKMPYRERKISLPKAGGETGESFVIGRDSLDTNHHVNNGKYIQFAEAYLPEKAKWHRLRVDYRSQARIGDSIVPQIYQTSETMTVALNAETGRPYAIVEFSLS